MRQTVLNDRADNSGYTYECPVCHFWKNSASEEGQPCRHIGCPGTVVKVEWVRAQPVLDLAKNLRREYVGHPSAPHDYLSGQTDAREAVADALMDLLPVVDLKVVK